MKHHCQSPYAGRLAGRGLLRSSVIGLISAWTIASAAEAADHGDAPLMALGPPADIADLFAFVSLSPDRSQTMLSIVLQVAPYQTPGAGPHYARFDDALMYNIHITDPVTAEDLLVYNFRFSDADPVGTPELKSGDTILSYGTETDGANTGPISAAGANRNYTQFYSVSRTDASRTTEIASGLATAPPNMGLKTTPLYNDLNGRALSGAQLFDQLDAYTQAGVRSLPGGEIVFAGPREDAFYADFAGIFDLFAQRVLFPSPNFPLEVGQQGGGPDTMAGTNVSVISMQVPVADLAPLASPYTLSVLGQDFPAEGVGVWASVSKPDGKGMGRKQRVQQLDRLGNPLLSLFFVALADKAALNSGTPDGDAAFAAHVLEPELARLINAEFGDLIGDVMENNRLDLANVMLPDILTVDITTGPVPLPGQAGFSRLGLFGGDTTAGMPSGWPNGRRLGDDVIDIVLTNLRSSPGDVRLFGDNVNANDQLYHQVMPYAATPHSGTNPD